MHCGTTGKEKNERVRQNGPWTSHPSHLFVEKRDELSYPKYLRVQTKRTNDISCERRGKRGCGWKKSSSGGCETPAQLDNIQLKRAHPENDENHETHKTRAREERRSCNESKIRGGLNEWGANEKKLTNGIWCIFAARGMRTM